MVVERAHDAPQIVLKNIARQYGAGEAAVHALRGIDLTIGAGEMVALMGPSGSGKSSMMNILGLFDRVSSGSYFLGGTDMTNLTARQQASFRGRKIAFVFQGIHLLPRLTAMANVDLPMSYARIPTAQRREAALNALEHLGVVGLKNRYPSQMSGGQAQRVAIARAIAPAPDVLLADEPTGALDRKSGQLVLGSFQRLHEQTGVTVIIVTHDAFVAQHAERIISLEDGQVVADQRVTDRLMVDETDGSEGHQS